MNEDNMALGVQVLQAFLFLLTVITQKTILPRGKRFQNSKGVSMRIGLLARMSKNEKH